MVFFEIDLLLPPQIKKIACDTHDISKTSLALPESVC